MPDLSYVSNLGLGGNYLYARDLLFVSFLIVLFVYDWKYMLLPDKFTIPAMIVALLLNLLFAFVSPLLMLSGALILGGFFWIQYVLSKGTWVGGGDIRLGVLMGFMLGLWQGLVALFLAYVIGAIVAVILLITGKADRKTQLPFGVFLTLGTVIMLLSGEVILDWYIGLLQ
jgi:prepilin signal peptidase PulO-like enzyme (type II secretory pathway)